MNLYWIYKYNDRICYTQNRQFFQESGVYLDWCNVYKVFEVHLNACPDFYWNILTISIKFDHLALQRYGSLQKFAIMCYLVKWSLSLVIYYYGHCYY